MSESPGRYVVWPSGSMAAANSRMVAGCAIFGCIDDGAGCCAYCGEALLPTDEPEEQA